MERRTRSSRRAERKGRWEAQKRKIESDQVLAWPGLAYVVESDLGEIVLEGAQEDTIRSGF